MAGKRCNCFSVHFRVAFFSLFIFFFSILMYPINNNINVQVKSTDSHIQQTKNFILCLYSVGMSHSGSTVGVNSKCVDPIVCDFVTCLHVLNAFLHWYSIIALFMSYNNCVCFGSEKINIQVYFPHSPRMSLTIVQFQTWFQIGHNQCRGPDMDQP